MKRLTMKRVFRAAVGAVAIAVACPGCSQSPEHHTWAEVSEAKKKGKFEIGPLKDAPKARTSPAAGTGKKKG